MDLQNFFNIVSASGIGATVALIFRIFFERDKFRFEKLHEKRALVIEQLYIRIVKVEQAFVSLLKPFQGVGELFEDEKRKVAAESFNELANYLIEHRVYFDERLAQDLERLIDKFLKIFNDYDFSRTLRQYKEDKESYRKSFEVSRGAWDELSRDFPIIRQSIEKEFRKIIGIKT